MAIHIETEEDANPSHDGDGSSQSATYFSDV